jgi:hypothetical protein
MTTIAYTRMNFFNNICRYFQIYEILTNLPKIRVEISISESVKESKTDGVSEDNRQHRKRNFYLSISSYYLFAGR